MSVTFDYSGIILSVMVENYKNQSYKDWMENPKAVERVIQDINKSGIPLEIKVRKILQNNSFIGGRAFYTVLKAGQISSEGSNDTVDVLHEIDVLASKAPVCSFSVSGFEIRFSAHVIAECKYSSDKDFYFFPCNDPCVIDLQNYPLMVNGHQLFEPFKRRTHAIQYPVPQIVDRVSEIDINSNTRKDENFNDRLTYGACTQLIQACENYLTQWRVEKRSDYNLILKDSSFLSSWKQQQVEGKIEFETIGSYTHVTDEYIRRFLKTYFRLDLLNAETTHNCIFIELLFPILVIAESRGVLKVELDSKYEIKGLEDIGFCIYLFRPEKPTQYPVTLHDSISLPVFICNQRYLEKVMEIIEEVTVTIANGMKKEIIAHQSLIGKEIMFNSSLIGLG